MMFLGCDMTPLPSSASLRYAQVLCSTDELEQTIDHRIVPRGNVYNPSAPDAELFLEALFEGNHNINALRQVQLLTK